VALAEVFDQRLLGETINEKLGGSLLRLVEVLS